LLSVGTRAGRIANFGNHGLELPAPANGVLHTTARGVGRRVLLELGSEVVLLHFGFNELRTARADLKMRAAARILYGHHSLAVFTRATALAHAVAGGKTDFGLYGLDLAAVADRVRLATARVGGLDFRRMKRLVRGRDANNNIGVRLRARGGVAIVCSGLVRSGLQKRHALRGIATGRSHDGGALIRW